MDVCCVFRGARHRARATYGMVVHRAQHATQNMHKEGAMQQVRTMTAVVLLLIAAGLLTGCNAAVETVQVSPLGWEILPLGVPQAEVYEILSVGNLQMPTYNDCADAAGTPQPATNVRWGYSSWPRRTTAAARPQTMPSMSKRSSVTYLRPENPLNRANTFGQRLRPFQFYATEYRYQGTTPGGGQCNPGLPGEWAPSQSNGRDVNAPAWDCNLALSTAATELDLGFILHKGDLTDRNRYNLFSSEYNSYAAIIHELSHATFAMSDEAPSTVQGGVFFPKIHPNVFSDEANCELACTSHQSKCVGIPKVEANGKINPNTQSGLFRCSSSAKDNEINIMYFYPQPKPGNNQSWGTYNYLYTAFDRLRHIFNDWCNQGRC